MGWIDKYQDGGVKLSTPSSFIESARDQHLHPENYVQNQMGYKDPNYAPQPGTAEYVPIEMLALPGTPAIKGIGKLANMAIDAINPFSGLGFKPNSEMAYRMIGGKEGLRDAIQSKMFRANPIGGEKEAFWAKGSPIEEYSEQMHSGVKKGLIPKKQYMVEAPLNHSNFRESDWDEDVMLGNIPMNDEGVKLYQKHWLRGYKEIPKKQDGGFLGTTNRGENFSPSWGGQFQEGGILKNIGFESSGSTDYSSYGDMSMGINKGPISIGAGMSKDFESQSMSPYIYGGANFGKNNITLSATPNREMFKTLPDVSYSRDLGKGWGVNAYGSPSGQSVGGGVTFNFQKGGNLHFLEPNDPKLPQGRIHPFYPEPSSELAQSIGGEQGEPAYLIPTFKYGHPLDNPYMEYQNTGDNLGGPFKTWQEADEWENNIRHPYVEKGQSLPSPLKRWGKDFQNGGTQPLIVNSPTDPRLQGYQDSLDLYNSYKDLKKKLIESNYQKLPKVSTNPLTRISDKEIIDYIDKGVSRSNWDLFGFNPGPKKSTMEKVKPSKIRDGLYQTLDFYPGLVNEDLGYQKFSTKIKPTSEEMWRRHRNVGDARLVKNYENVKPRKEVIYEPKLEEPINPSPKKKITPNLRKDSSINRIPIRELTFQSPQEEINISKYPNIDNHSSSQEVTDFNYYPGYSRAWKDENREAGYINYGDNTGRHSFTYKELQEDPRWQNLVKSYGYKLPESTKLANYQNGGEMSFYQQGRDWQPRMISENGGEIKQDNLGYYNPENWGKPVQINSNNITMRNVPFDIKAISDTGEQKILKANSKGHVFSGNKVTEYPIGKYGITEYKELTDFSNKPLKKKSGGWIQKYVNA